MCDAALTLRVLSPDGAGAAAPVGRERVLDTSARERDAAGTPLPGSDRPHSETQRAQKGRRAAQPDCSVDCQTQEENSLGRARIATKRALSPAGVCPSLEKFAISVLGLPRTNTLAVAAQKISWDPDPPGLRLGGDAAGSWASWAARARVTGCVWRGQPTWSSASSDGCSEARSAGQVVRCKRRRNKAGKGAWHSPTDCARACTRTRTET
eukprot:2333364-Rhodomonas_salina.4